MFHGKRKHPGDFGRPGGFQGRPGPYMNGPPRGRYPPQQQQYRRGPSVQQGPKRFFRSDKQVAEALEVFEALFKAEAKAKATKETETETPGEAEAEKPMSDETAEAATAAETEPLMLSTQQLSDGYKANATGTNGNFKGVFRRTVSEFLAQFTDQFALVKPGHYRLLSTEEMEEAARKAREEEEEREAKRAKQDTERRKKKAEWVRKEQQATRDKSVNVLLSADGGIEKEAVRRAINTVFATARHRQAARFVLVTTDAGVDADRKQCVGSDEVSKAAHKRLQAACAQHVLLPTMLKGRTPILDSEVLYKAIIPSELEQVLAKEAKDQEEAAAARREALVQREAERKERLAEAKAAKRTAAMENETEEEKAAREAAEAKEEEEEAAKEAAEKEKKDAEEAEAKAKAAAEDPPEPREVVVADFYVAIETGLVKQSFESLDSAALPIKPKKETKKEGDKKEDDAEKKEEEQEAEKTPLQKATAALRAIVNAPADLPEFDQADRAASLGSEQWQSMSWVVVYCANTGFSVRVPTAAVTLSSSAVEKSLALENGTEKMEDDADAETAKSPASTTALATTAAALADMLKMKVSPEDPHAHLTGGTLSRGHLLEQALVIAFGQLAQREMARFQQAAAKRQEAVNAAKAAQREAREAEKTARLEAEAKAKAEAAKAKADAEAEAAKADAEAEAAKADAEAEAKAAEAEVGAEAAPEVEEPAAVEAE